MTSQAFDTYSDVLGDRIGIMAKGKLRCIGHSLHLKNKFGDGFRVNLQTSIPNVPELKSAVKDLLPGAELHIHTGGSLTYKVRR